MQTTDNQRQAQGAQTELDRDRQAGGEEFIDGEVAKVKARAKIELRNGFQIEQVLCPERLVQVIDLVQIFHHLGLKRAFEVERPARRDPDQKERDCYNQKNRRDCAQQSTEHVAGHQLALLIPR
jgi:hypothetical protein